MTLGIGDIVVVRRLRKKGRIERKVGDARWRVLCDGLSVVCEEAELEPLSTPPQGRSPRTSTARSYRRVRPLPAQTLTFKVDLHGLRRDDAITRLEDAVNSTLLAGGDHLVVIYGRGTGALRHAVLDWIARSNVAARIVEREFNPGVADLYF